MPSIERISAALFVGIVLLGSGASFLSMESAPKAPAEPAWTPPPLPAPLTRVAAKCRASMEKQRIVLGAGRARIALRPGPLCGCIARRLGSRFQDDRSAAFADSHLRAMINAEKRKRRLRKFYRSARREARSLGMSDGHWRAVALHLNASAEACIADPGYATAG